MKELSRLLKIPPRTLRYRLSRLRSQRYLLPFRYSTREKRIGLGEHIIILEPHPSKRPFPTEFFEKTQAVGWYTPTYGRMNGFLANIIYPVEEPELNTRVLEVLLDTGMISDYSIFNLASYSTKGWDLSKFDSDGRWIWEWETWYQHIDSIQKDDSYGTSVELETETQIPYDAKDVHLLRMLHENPNVTQKQMSSRLDLPVSQVRRRFQRLQEFDVIRGYKPVFTPFRNTLTIMCFIESRKAIGQILACMYELPYTLDVYIEAPTSIGIRIRLSTTHIVGFFRGLDRLHHLADSLSIQILHNAVPFGSTRLYDLYSEEEDRWVTHNSEYFRWLEDWSRSKTP